MLEVCLTKGGATGIATEALTRIVGRVLSF